MVKASQELVVYFKNDIQQPAHAICELINLYLSDPFSAELVKPSGNFDEIFEATVALEALQSAMSGQPFPETRDVDIFPDDIRFKAIAGIYNYCASLINEGSLLLYGQSSAHNILPNFMLKNLAIDSTATKIESLPDGPYPNALVYEESDAYRALFTKENPLARLANSYSNFINKHLHIRFAISKQGCDALLDYLNQYNIIHIVDIIAGRGYTKRLLQSSGFAQIRIHACDTKDQDFTFTPVDTYDSFGPMDAIKYIRYIRHIIEAPKRSSDISAQAPQPGDLSQFALLITAPPAFIKTNGDDQPIGDYLPSVYSMWHEGKGGPVCLFSECTDVEQLHSPKRMQANRLKTVDLSPGFPDSLLSDLGTIRGTAKAFTLHALNPEQETP